MVLHLAGRGVVARAAGIKAVLLLGGGGTGVLVAGIVLILVLAVGLGDGAQITTTTETGDCPVGAATCTGQEFDPGNIISDKEFYNAAAMTEPQIRDFIAEQGAACTSSDCLRTVRVTMPDQPADRYCAAVTGGTGLDAAAVIARVSVACRVNPRVMLVTLQKESRLLNRTDPTPASYAAAWGWHCPDTGPGGTANCDPAHAGLVNQAYGMAKQWSRYRTDPGKYTYRAGQTVNILFNVAESGCGSAPVTITNTATARLYNYTPYQPNPASLAAYPGTGDRCSSYGNRNFFYLYQDYFGSTGGGKPSTTPGGTPVGGTGTSNRTADGVRDHRHRHRTHRAGRDRDPGRTVLARHPIRVGRRQRPGPHLGHQGRLHRAVPGPPGLDHHRIRLLRTDSLRLGAGRGRAVPRLLRPGQPRAPTPLHPGFAGDLLFWGGSRDPPRRHVSRPRQRPALHGRSTPERRSREGFRRADRRRLQQHRRPTLSPWLATSSGGIGMTHIAEAGRTRLYTRRQRRRIRFAVLLALVGGIGAVAIGTGIASWLRSEWQWPILETRSIREDGSGLLGVGTRAGEPLGALRFPVAIAWPEMNTRTAAVIAVALWLGWLVLLVRPVGRGLSRQTRHRGLARKRRIRAALGARAARRAGRFTRPGLTRLQRFLLPTNSVRVPAAQTDDPEEPAGGVGGLGTTDPDHRPHRVGQRRPPAHPDHPGAARAGAGRVHRTQHLHPDRAGPHPPPRPAPLPLAPLLQPRGGSGAAVPGRGRRLLRPRQPVGRRLPPGAVEPDPRLPGSHDRAPPRRSTRRGRRQHQRPRIRLATGSSAAPPPRSSPPGCTPPPSATAASTTSWTGCGTPTTPPPPGSWKTTPTTPTPPPSSTWPPTSTPARPRPPAVCCGTSRSR